MAEPLMPSPLDYVGRQQFAFDPAVGPVEHNVWLLGAGSWSEVQVTNAHSGRDFWLPRHYVGAVSDEEMLVVGLTERLQMQGGELVRCASRRVLEMPAPKDQPLATNSQGPGVLIGIRLEKKPPRAYQKPPVRVGIALLFVAGLLALVQSATH